MRYLCRCSNEKCRLRRTLAHHPSWYKRPPKCYGCGGRKFYWDAWQQRSNAKLRCQCGGYHFIHRKGSKWCEHAVGTITPAEAAERWGGTALDYHFVDDPRIIHNTKDDSDDPPF